MSVLLLFQAVKRPKTFCCCRERGARALEERLGKKATAGQAASHSPPSAQLPDIEAPGPQDTEESAE